MENVQNNQGDVSKIPFFQRPFTYKVAVFYMFILGTQFVWIEGFSVSLLKAAAMVLSPLLFLMCRVKFGSAWIFSGLYFLLICMSIIFRGESFNLSVFYTLGCLCTFSTFSSLVDSGVFTYDDAVDILKKFIYLYTVFLLLQQIKSYTGIGFSPLINYWEISYNGLRKFNSLFIEPSHLGRVLAIVLLGYLELKRLMYNEKLSLKTLWANDRWVLIAALYTLFMSGSGAAIIAMIVLGGYVIMRGSPGFILFALIAVLALSPFLQEMDHVQRAVSTLEVSTTLDMEQIRKNDISASARVAPLIAFIENFRPGELDFWFGQSKNSSDYNSNIGIITLYGALAYIGLLLLLFLCCFRSLISVEFIFFCGLYAATVGNVAYVWFSMMILAIIKYFYQKEKCNDISSVKAKQVV